MCALLHDIGHGVFSHVSESALDHFDEIRTALIEFANFSHVERHTAAVALNKGYTVLTSADNVAAFDGMQCAVKDLAGWADEIE